MINSLGKIELKNFLNNGHSIVANGNVNYIQTKIILMSNTMPISSKQEYFKNFGYPLRKFLVERYGNIKKAAWLLKFSPTLLSQYINGHKYPSRKLEEALRIQGFDMEYFDKIRSEQELAHLVEGADATGLNWEQLKFLVVELKGVIKDKNATIESQKKVIQILDNRVRELSQRAG